MTDLNIRPDELDRTPTGIPGLDLVTGGGLPARRLTLVVGTAGSGKTVLAAQFLSDGIEHDEPGVFVTFEEPPAYVRENLRSLGARIEDWEAENRWRFVDASPAFEDEVVVAGAYDMSSLILRVAHAIEDIGAKRVAIDSIGALIAQFDPAHARQALFQLGAHLRAAGVTSIMTAERNDDYGALSHYGFEEFVADNVIVLRNALDADKRRRTVEVLKLRGGWHLRGEHLFTLVAGEGMVVVPHEIAGFGPGTSSKRVSSGNDGLDTMLEGGLYERSIVLVTGPTGTGKSLLANEFVARGTVRGERALLLSFEEGRDQLIRNAAGWGIDFDALESQGLLRIVSEAPESRPIEDHLLRTQEVIAEFKPQRVAIDSLTALQRVSTVKSFREYLVALTFHIKTNAMLGLVTVASADLAAGPPFGDLHVSTISDTIIVLQYLAVESEIRRGINVLKMRGSDHDKAIREFRIDDHGLQIGDPFGQRVWTRYPQVF